MKIRCFYHHIMGILLHATIILALAVGPCSIAYAQSVPIPSSIPGAADVGRVKPEEREPVTQHNQDIGIKVPSGPDVRIVPKGAKDIHFILHDVHITGATVLTPKQLHEIYAPYLETDITLDVVYSIAATITDRYRSAGYFLSLAYVPDQHIKDGIITLNVTEGYIGSVEVDDALRKRWIINFFIKDLLALKPLKSDALESFLLRLNDLPGLSFRAVLSTIDHADNGAVKLTLIPAVKAGRGQISFDNFGSRYLGPNEISASYSTSLLPLQQTIVSGLTTLPVTPLHYGAVDHAIVIAPNLTFDISANVTADRPGYSLEKYDIKGNSTYLSASLAYQWIRQREENVAFKVTLDSRNTNSDLLDQPFTRDRVRAVRGNITYDSSDSWHGFNMAGLTLSRGLRIFDATAPDDPNLSRAGATPDFTKIELSLSRLQDLTHSWSLLAAASSQAASGVLYSSEQFGYGGQSFGRAYDASEITGDNGVAASLELRYDGIGEWSHLNFEPYSFCDFGTVWNDGVGQPIRESGTSAGFGMRAISSIGTSGNIGFAWPLTRQIATPIYDGASQGPRVLLQISQGL